MYVVGDDFADESSHKTKICTEGDIGNIPLSCLLIAESVNNVFCFTHVKTSASREGTQWQIKKCSFRARYENEACSPHVISFFFVFFFIAFFKSKPDPFRD